MKTTQFEGKIITIPVKLLDLLKIKKVVLLASNQLNRTQSNLAPSSPLTFPPLTFEHSYPVTGKGIATPKVATLNLVKLPQVSVIIPSLKENYHQKLIITGPLGEQSILIPKDINIEIEHNNIKLSKLNNIGTKDTKLSSERDINKLINLNSSLINQMIVGVTEGFKKQIKLIGIGYKINWMSNFNLSPNSNVAMTSAGSSYPKGEISVATKGQELMGGLGAASLTLNIGFSHPVTINIPKNIKLSEEAIKENKTDQSALILNSTSLIDLNNFVYSIKRIRPVEKSFKGTGITINTP